MDSIAIANLNKTRIQTQTIIINGVPQTAPEVIQYFVECSHCKRILGQFNPGDPLNAVIDVCKNQVAKDLIYCPTCGYKLDYTMDILELTDGQE